MVLPDKFDINGATFRDWRAEGNPTFCRCTLGKAISNPCWTFKSVLLIES